MAEKKEVLKLTGNYHLTVNIDWEFKTTGSHSLHQEVQEYCFKNGQHSRR